MRARVATIEKAADQREVIAILRAGGAMRLADRLDRCMAVRLARCRGGGWPSWTCRSAGCRWCGSTMARRWWLGLRAWIEQSGAIVSLAVVPAHHQPGGLRAAVARLRRMLRDLRDRQARRHARWCGVAMAGMVASGDVAFVLIQHADMARSEVGGILRGRWPRAVISNPDASPPSWRFSAPDAAELARIGRGVEPLRIVVLPQRIADGCPHRTSAPPVTIEPLPTCVQ
jgi:hypothetical protein